MLFMTIMCFKVVMVMIPSKFYSSASICESSIRISDLLYMNGFRGTESGPSPPQITRKKKLKAKKRVFFVNWSISKLKAGSVLARVNFDSKGEKNK